jgi:hypothetical protein
MEYYFSEKKAREWEETKDAFLPPLRVGSQPSLQEQAEVAVDQVHYSTECNWVQDIPVREINDYEKDMLKNTKNAQELLAQEEYEKNNPPKVTEEEKQEQFKRNYINKVKVIALDSLGLYPIANPSNFPDKLKQKVIETMRDVINLYGDDEAAITKAFNDVCIDKIFNKSVDYTKFPIYA